MSMLMGLSRRSTRRASAPEPIAEVRFLGPATWDWFHGTGFLLRVSHDTSQTIKPRFAWGIRMPAQVHAFLCLQDNIGALIHDPNTGACAAIDAPEEAPILAALAETGWQLTDILVTHRHS